jgi:hypothetical protein
MIFSYKKYSYPWIWLWLNLNDYNSKTDDEKIIQYIMDNNFKKNYIEERDIDLNKWIWFLNNIWVNYNNISLYVNENYIIENKISNLNDIKWNTLSYKLNLFDTSDEAISWWVISINTNKWDIFLEKWYISATLNCNWKTDNFALKNFWNYKNLVLDLNWKNYNFPLNGNNCYIDLKLNIDSNISDNELLKNFNNLMINIYLDNFHYWNFYIKNKEYHIWIWWIKNVVDLTINNLNIPKCKLYLLDEDWNEIDNNFEWKLNQIYWYVLYNWNSQACWADWCKKLLWVKINLKLNSPTNNWKFLNTNKISNINNWLNDYILDWINSLWNIWKKIISYLSNNYVKNQEINIFIPSNFYQINLVWKNSFVVIPSNMNLDKFNFNVTATCKFIYSDWTENSLNWWNVSYKYKVDNWKDYAYINFYNPNLNDWNIIYAPWYTMKQNSDWSITMLKYYKPSIMRLSYYRNWDIYFKTYFRSDSNYNWDEDNIWINPWTSKT